MTIKEKLWWLAVDWFEACDGYTIGPAADRHWTYLFLWANADDLTRAAAAMAEGKED